MSVTTSNYHFASNGWCNTSMMMMANGSSETPNGGNVDDGLTSLSWLQNLNMCMTRLGAPTPPTPPASPINSLSNAMTSNGKMFSPMDLPHCNYIPSKLHSFHREKVYHTNGHSNPKKSHVIQEEPIDYKTNGNTKPPYSYATLICMAMKANKNKMTLSAIYKWIRDNFLYYKNADPSWQNSIRHNLSLNKCFIKIPRNKDEPGKGGFWRLDPVYADTLVDGVFKKRRPSQRGNHLGNSKNTSAPFRKKSRKKDQLNNQLEKGIVSNRSDKSISSLLHETPPNSAESYKHYSEHVTEVVELATAVSSIEPVGHCNSYSYGMHQSNDNQLVHQGYADEVCITTATSEGCILSADGNEICWNAILTDADLNQLVDPASYTSQEVHPVVSSPNLNENTTTAQLTAVEPHSLHLVSNGTQTLDDSEIFQNNVGQINCEININNNNSNICTEVISATHNVVTCVNPSSVNANDWSQWSCFPVLTQINSNLRNQSGVNCELQNNALRPSQPITYVTTESNRIEQNGGNTIPSGQPTSPNSANFDHQTALQPWAECKAALEAAALDLENFGDLDTVQAY